MAKKIRRIDGGVLEIHLPNGRYGYGIVLTDPLVGFYDIQSDVPKTLEEVSKSKLVFKIWVMNHAITSGRWRLIGNLPLDEHMLEVPNFYKQDPITGELSIYINDEEFPATVSECQGLECAAVWEPEHVEERLVDHFLGVQNRWLESMKIR